MRDDLHLKFLGFSRCNSRCHVRILSDPGKPLVVICSQVKINPGTSITNAFEIIREHIFCYLKNKKSEKLQKNTAAELNFLAEEIEEIKSLRVAIVTYLLRLTARVLTDRLTIFDQVKRKAQEFYWVEHWPNHSWAGESFPYRLVWENERGDPQWGKFNSSELAENLGYSKVDFEIPDEAIV